MRTVTYMAGWFERAPDHDLETGSHEWRAFRYLGDGGIWYARDDEDYTFCRKDMCYSCGGRGGIDLGYGSRPGPLICPWPSPRRVLAWSREALCPVCDGRGFVFVPSRILGG